MKEGEKKTILVADDVKLFQLFLKYSLSAGKYNLIFTETGEGALDIIMKKNIDLLILDMELPDISGLEVLKRIRDLTKDMESVVQLKDLPVIIVTAYPTGKTKHQAEKLGISAFLPKPIKKEEIRRIVEKSLEEKFQIYSQRKLILCVESEPRVQKFYQRVLGTAHWDIICASNGLEALEMVEYQNPNLILTELNLPQMSGWEFLEALKQAERDIPVIVVSSVTDKESIQKARKMGIKEYLTKPFQLGKLKNAIQESLESKGEVK